MVLRFEPQLISFKAPLEIPCTQPTHTDMWPWEHNNNFLSNTACYLLIVYVNIDIFFSLHNFDMVTYSGIISLRHMITRFNKSLTLCALFWVPGGMYNNLPRKIPTREFHWPHLFHIASFRSLQLLSSIPFVVTVSLPWAEQADQCPVSTSVFS